MPASRASVSSRMPNRQPEDAPILVCAPNWIGDSIMAMPALQYFRGRHPRAYVAVLAKPSVAPLWRMHRVPNEIIEIQPGAAGTLNTGHELRRRGFQSAWVLPNSFRSVLIPWLAQIPRRIGFRGHARRFLLTEIVRLPATLAARHQAWEYMYLLGGPLSSETVLEPPHLTIPPQASANAAQLVQSEDRPYVVLMPGAARGTSKRWPAPYFAALGTKLAERGLLVVVSGAPNERDLCEEVANRIGRGTRQLAGRTSLSEWAALLAGARLVVCNDSGGMHLAAAVGTPTIALYGITDPTKTGPLGSHCRVLQNSPVRSRDVSRESDLAAQWLASITPDQVYEEATKMLSARQKSVRNDPQD